MTNPRPADLVLLDLALEAELLTAEDACKHLRSGWSVSDAQTSWLRDALATLAGEESLQRLEAQVSALISDVGGDPQRCLALRGGIDRAVYIELDRVAPEVGRWLTSLGAGPRTPLRALTPGRYLDFLPVGEGGMGVVYRTLDTELNRYVALKMVRDGSSSGAADITPSAPLAAGDDANVISEGADRAQREARFLQEAWITGALEHPGIVPVYELGRTAAGQPFYTMRMVGGDRTLATAISATGTFDERALLLEAFIKICDTMSYAHSREVIHRDLKSNNVALGEFGEVFVLDWGLAKSKSAPDVAADNWHRKIQDYRNAQDLQTVSIALGTPGHMSPEAARAQTELVDERSDIYSLGVILFEILTGRLPFEFDTFDEYLRKVSADAAPRADELDPSVPPALADICVRALVRDPEGRWGSAAELASRVRSWRVESAIDREVHELLVQAQAAIDGASELSGDELLRQLDRSTAACRRVLQQRPDNEQAQAILDAAHRQRERGIRQREHAVRRRALSRVGIIALTVVSVAAVIVSAVLQEQTQKAEQARIRAVSERESAEEVLEFLLFDLREQLEPLGRLDLLAQVAARSKDYYESLPAEGIAAETQDRRAVALINLGDVFQEQGNLPAAQTSFEAARGIADELAKGDPQQSLWRFRRAHCEAKRAATLIGQGDRVGALPVLREQVRVMEQLAGAHPGNAEMRSVLIFAQTLLGDALRTQGDWPGAATAFQRARAYADALSRQHPNEVRWRREAVAKRVALSRLLLLQSQPKEALSTAFQAREMARGLNAEQPLDVRCQVELANSYMGVGNALLALRPTTTAAEQEALSSFEEGLAIWTQLSSREPSNRSWLEKVARTRLAIGDQRKEQKDLERAWPAFQSAFAALQQLAELDPTNAEWQRLLATLCDRLAGSCPDPEDALSYRHQAVQIAEQLLERHPEDAMWRHLVAFTRWMVAYLHWQRKEPDKARAELIVAIDVGRPLAQEFLDDVEVQDMFLKCLRLMASIHENLEDDTRAVEFIEESRAWSEKLALHAPAEVLWLGHLLQSAWRKAQLVDTETIAGRDEARRCLEQALAARTKIGELGKPPEWTGYYVEQIEKKLSELRE